MEADLEPIIRLLVKNRWPFRLHATYGESIDRMLDVFEKVNTEIPFNGLRWFFDHAETITPQELERVKKLQGGIAVQFRMYYQGELYKKMYGRQKHNCLLSRKCYKWEFQLVWELTQQEYQHIIRGWPYIGLLQERLLGGMQFWPEDQVLDKFTALQLYTSGSAWFSGEEKEKGKLIKGMYADLAILSDDYFTLPPNDIRTIESLLTVVNGKVVYAKSQFEKYSPPVPEVFLIWSPIKYYGGYQN